MSNEITNRFEEAVRIGSDGSTIISRTTGVLSAVKDAEGITTVEFQGLPGSQEIQIGLSVQNDNDGGNSIYDLDLGTDPSVTIQSFDATGDPADTGFCLIIWRLNSTDGEN